MGVPHGAAGHSANTRHRHSCGTIRDLGEHFAGKSPQVRQTFGRVIEIFRRKVRYARPTPRPGRTALRVGCADRFVRSVHIRAVARTAVTVPAGPGSTRAVAHVGTPVMSRRRGPAGPTGPRIRARGRRAAGGWRWAAARRRRHGDADTSGQQTGCDGPADDKPAEPATRSPGWHMSLLLSDTSQRDLRWLQPGGPNSCRPGSRLSNPSQDEAPSESVWIRARKFS